MKDELKLFTDKNRESFEKYHLDISEAWNGVEDRLEDIEHKSGSNPWKVILKIAAILIVMISLTFGFYLNNQRIAYNNKGIALHNISSELADTEAFYTSKIDEKIKLIEISTGDIDPAVKNQLHILDEDYQSLKNDIRDDADSEEVINAMIEYYRLKLAMLEKILDEVQKNNDNKDHEEALAI